MRLGYQLDSSTFAQLARIQADLQQSQAKLTYALDNRTISPESYMDEVSRLLQTSMTRSRDLLGDTQFVALFGDAGRHPEAIIDRDAFEASLHSAH